MRKHMLWDGKGWKKGPGNTEEPPLKVFSVSLPSDCGSEVQTENGLWHFSTLTGETASRLPAQTFTHGRRGQYCADWEQLSGDKPAKAHMVSQPGNPGINAQPTQQTPVAAYLTYKATSEACRHRSPVLFCLCSSADRNPSPNTLGTHLLSPPPDSELFT